MHISYSMNIAGSRKKRAYISNTQSIHKHTSPNETETETFPYIVNSPRFYYRYVYSMSDLRPDWAGWCRYVLGELNQPLGKVWKGNKKGSRIMVWPLWFHWAVGEVTEDCVSVRCRVISRGWCWHLRGVHEWTTAHDSVCVYFKSLFLKKTKQNFHSRATACPLDMSSISRFVILDYIKSTEQFTGKDSWEDSSWFECWLLWSRKKPQNLSCAYNSLRSLKLN